MDNQASIYSEKKIASYESIYKESMLSKPQEVNVTVTAEHIYGMAYICDQTGTKEEDPVYSRFSCGLEEITKIYINNNNRNSPIYIQCDSDAKSVLNRRRIILPCFSNNEEIVNVISSAKAELDKKLEKKKAEEKNQKLKELESRRKAMDDEFESMTSGYEEFKKSLANEHNEKAAAKAGSKSASKAEAAPKSEPAPAPKAEAAPKPAPAPAPAPKAEAAPKPAPAPAPAPKAEAAPKPAPAPAPAPKAEAAPKPAPAPAPAPKSEPAPAPASKAAIAETFAPDTMPAPPHGGSVTVDDILSLDEFLGIHAEENDFEASMAAVESEPDEDAINAIPEEILQKKPADIEEIAISEQAYDIPEKPKTEEKAFSAAIEELDPAKEIAKKLAPQPEPKKAPKPEPEKPAPAPEPEDEPVQDADPIIEKSGVDMSLDEFETAMKKLKSMLDNGVITENEFAHEKKKLLSNLY